MSNQRRPGMFKLYRFGYLRSGAWFARRDKWFAEELTRRGSITCAACGREAPKRRLELHHLDYDRVSLEDGRWHGQEAHEDLVSLHSYCHELLHRLIDRDSVLSRNRTRRAASHLALERLRQKVTPVEGAS